MMQGYAALAFTSLADLESLVRDAKVEPSHELSRSRLGKERSLKTRVVAKFHYVGEDRIEPHNALAQIELVDLPNDDNLLNPYRVQLIDQGYGRVSVVGNGGMTYDLASQLSQLLSFQDILERIEEAMPDFDDTTANVKDLLVLKAEVQRDFHALSDTRHKSRFSNFENQLYGHALSAIAHFSMALTLYVLKVDYRPLARTLRSPAGQAMLRAQEMDDERLSEELQSAQGVNKTQYFSPLPKPEEIMLGLR